MNNNVLVIHPDDGSVGYDIYQYLYDGLGYDIISDASISDSELTSSIAEHETIIIIGCFTDDGMVMFSKTEHNSFYFINDSHVALLKNKRIISIGGRRFFEQNEVSGLHIDAILTSTFEATLYDIDATEDEIRDSALRFMSIVRSVLDVRNPREMRAKIFEEYSEKTPVEKFNKKGIIAL
jgi:hypothetical protein